MLEAAVETFAQAHPQTQLPNGNCIGRAVELLNNLRVVVPSGPHPEDPKLVLCFSLPPTNSKLGPALCRLLEVVSNGANRRLFFPPLHTQANLC